MAGTRSILALAAELLAAWKQIDPDLQAGRVTQAAFADELTQAQAMQTQIQALELQLTDLRTKRDERMIRVWDTVKRTRATVKGAYGDDSTEYKLIGGTRMSERRRPVRRSQEA
ncbi:MAG TPA: hypothetical protein VFO07_16680 [Roseiflexaceae bacterium]|nr:hypothetical protein [Roseiflexaceae bacterium]